MQRLRPRTFRQSVVSSKQPVRILIASTLVMALLTSGTALVTAREMPASDQTHTEPQTRAFHPLFDDGVTEPGGFSARRAPSEAASAGLSTYATEPLLTSYVAPLQDLIYSAFALDVYPNEELVKIPDVTDPGTWEIIASVAGTKYYAGDFVGGDDTTLYVLDLGANELHTLDVRTGADTTVGPSVPMSGESWTGATGTADGTLYASSSSGTGSTLYKINLSTGAATVVGEIANAPCVIDIAINAAGEMYGLDTCSDVLVGINPLTAAGTVIGAVGFDADFAQSMDFEERSGVLYLAAYNATESRGELRIADTNTGASVLVSPFPGGAEVDALAFAEPTAAPVQVVGNPGFENGWQYWTTEGYPALSSTSYSGAYSARFSGEEAWAWQLVHIPADATQVSISYWLTGISSDHDYDNDILCGGLWDLTRQTELATACFGLAYFNSYPMKWRNRSHDLDAQELASVAGQVALLGIRIEQDWLPGYSDTSTAYVDDMALLVTTPLYDYQLLLPVVVK
jgi:hypothetical protein